MSWIKNNTLTFLWLICFALLFIVAILQPKDLQTVDGSIFSTVLHIFLAYLITITIITPIVAIRRYLKQVKTHSNSRIHPKEMVPFIICWTIAIAIFIYFIKDNVFIARTAMFMAISFSTYMGTRLKMNKKKHALLEQIKSALKTLSTINLKIVKHHVVSKINNLANEIELATTAKSLTSGEINTAKLLDLVNLMQKFPTTLINHRYNLLHDEFLFYNKINSVVELPKNKMSFLNFFSRNTNKRKLIDNQASEILITNKRIINTNITQSFVIYKEHIKQISIDYHMNNTNCNINQGVV